MPFSPNVISTDCPSSSRSLSSCLTLMYTHTPIADWDYDCAFNPKSCNTASCTLSSPTGSTTSCESGCTAKLVSCGANCQSILKSGICSGNPNNIFIL